MRGGPDRLPAPPSHVPASIGTALHYPVKKILRRLLFLVAPAALFIAASPPAIDRLFVRDGDEWLEWWRSDRAPRAWTAAHPVIENAIRWRQLDRGVELGELELAGANRLLRFRVIIARFDPTQVEIRPRLALASNGLSGAWTIDSADTRAILSFNAGQFAETGPWGWVQVNGSLLRYSARGPLAAGLVVDQNGSLRLVQPDSVEAVERAGNALHAFQSYPMVLWNDSVPRLIGDARAMDIEHRDIRFGIGELRDGRWIVALTRWDFGRQLERIPVGLTTREMTAVLGALGARNAMLLDGGLSAQLQVRDSTGVVMQWKGVRKVPLGLEILHPRTLSQGR